MSQSAINKWKKKPEWIEIENKLREQKARVFMDNFTDETKKEFAKMLERSKKIAGAFEEDTITSLKIARAVKDEALAKLEQKKISAEKAGKISEISTPHQGAAVRSHKEARETWEHIYGLSEILKIMDKEGLLDEVDPPETQSENRDDDKDD